jgi:phosphate starvation-inducible PhoH-like protein
MTDRSIEVERMEHVISVFGSFDQNLRLIESELGVRILDRENQIHTPKPSLAFLGSYNRQ